MRSRFLASFLLIAVVTLLSSSAWADALSLAESTVYGKVVAVHAASVEFAQGCGAARTSYPRDQVRQIELNGSCRPRPVAPSSGGVGLCDDALSLYEVELVNGVRVDAADYQLDDRRVHIRSADGLTALHGDRSQVRRVTRRLICRNALADSGELTGFCREKVQFAVNFGPETVFGNQILTRGMSFFLEDEAGHPVPTDNPAGAIIRDAFGTALTEWMGALQDRSSALPPEGQAALAGMVSTSQSGYRLLTPPQVVQVGCIDTASFVIRYAFKNQKGLVVNGDTKAARAELKGRAIWINGVAYPCWKASPRAEIRLDDPATPASQGRCYNLVPILVHELGHAFGLVGHRDQPTASIMDSQIRAAALRPTAADADDLLSILLSPIVGAPAGRLDADGLGVSIAR